MRKIIVVLAILAVVGLVFPQPSQAVDLSPGDLIKAPDFSTVYYYGYDGKRHTFPNANVYFSWYSDFSNVKTVSRTELASIDLGKNILIRPGTHLVKIVTNPDVYVVEPDGVLKLLMSPAQAETLYGSAWKSKVIDLPDAFYTDYKNSGPLIKDYHPTGTVFRYQGEPGYYLLTNGYSRKFVSLVTWRNYHFNDKFILSLPYQDFRYKAGADIDQYKVALADTAQTLIVDEASDLINYSVGGGSEVSQANTGGLRGTYYNGKNFDSKVFDRVDSQINFDWGGGNPGNNLPNDNFSVRWEGEIDINSNESVTFYTYSDDGVRLYIDGKLIIDNWTDHALTWNSGAINLSSGRHAVKLEYYEVGGGAIIKWYWRGQSELVPSNILYSR